MVSAAIIAICITLIYIGTRTSFWIFKALAGISFFGLGAWWIQNPIGDDASSPVQSIMMLVAFFVGISCFFWSFWTTKTSNGQETGKLKIPFITPSDEEEEEERRLSRQPSRQERNAVYSRRVKGALQGRGQRRR